MPRGVHGCLAVASEVGAMRYTALSVILALFVVIAANAQTSQQYATGACWEAGLAGSPEVALFGAASVAATGGNIYVLQGNALLKLGPDMRELASVRLPDLSLAVAAVEGTRFEITCGMQGPELGYVYGPEAPLTTYPDGWMNTCGAGAAASTDTQTGLQQCVDQNMLQGLHQAHTLSGLSQAALAADQNGVYLLRGGRLSVFDHNLREMRGKEIMKPVATATECPICVAMMSNGAVMDQLRLRGMAAGLCPAPGQFRYDWSRGTSGGLIPTSFPEKPTEEVEPTGTAAPAAPGLGPGASITPRSPATNGGVPVPTGFGATTGFGTGVTIPTGFETTMEGTTAPPARTTTPTSATSAPAASTLAPAKPPARETGYTVVTNNEVETSFETEAPVECPAPRAGQYGWMWDLPELVPGAIYPIARRPIPGGNVFLGVSGDQQRGPQQLHVHALLADGKPDLQAQVVSAYLYQRGDVDAGRTLAIQKHAPGEYTIQFDPAGMRGDTLAVRVSRPGLREEVVYLPLSGPEPQTPRVNP